MASHEEKKGRERKKTEARAKASFHSCSLNS
jgi:hypothetical protein